MITLMTSPNTYSTDDPTDDPTDVTNDIPTYVPNDPIIEPILFIYFWQSYSV